jgi:hypothetical protein
MQMIDECVTPKEMKKYQAAFDKLPDEQQAEIRTLAEACTAASAAHAEAVEAEGNASEEQRRVYMRFEKRARALGLPVPYGLCFE